MGSLLPMPFGQQPGSEGLMQSLMQQQKQLMQKLNDLMNEESKNNPGGNEQGGLGKALDDMNEIIKDFEINRTLCYSRISFLSCMSCKYLSIM